MQQICLFPGTFDPITLGHVDIIKRALPLFDQIIVAIGSNSGKAPMYTTSQRQEWIEGIFKDEKKITAAVYDGLTVDFCRSRDAHYILRGVRSVADFEYERAIAHMNKSMHTGIETVLLYAQPELISVSSTIVREIIKNKGDVSQFLPSGVDVYA